MKEAAELSEREGRTQPFIHVVWICNCEHCSYRKNRTCRDKSLDYLLYGKKSFLRYIFHNREIFLAKTFDEILKTWDCEQSAQKALTSRQSFRQRCSFETIPGGQRSEEAAWNQPDTSLTLGEVTCDSLARKRVFLQLQTLETTERSYQRVTSYAHFSVFLWTGDARLYCKEPKLFCFKHQINNIVFL